jgi:lysozyme
MTLEISPSMVDHIKAWEGGPFLTAYLCPAGVWTIGYGHTLGVSKGMTCSEANADEFLEEDLAAVQDSLEHSLAAYTSLFISQNQWDALVSCSFNAGSLPSIAPKCWAAVTTGNLSEAAFQMLSIDHALVSGSMVVLVGLALRRAFEASRYMGWA